MLYAITHRHTGEPIAEVEIDCAVRASGAIKKGIAAQIAVENKISLADADLRGANLTGARLRRAKLVGADLRGATLAGARLAYAKLSRADLRGVDLSRATLASADLSDADLTGADLTRATLGSANLGGVDLRGADLTDAVGTHARLVGRCPIVMVGPLTPDTGAVVAQRDVDGVHVVDASWWFRGRLADFREAVAERRAAAVYAALCDWLEVWGAQRD